MQHEKARELFSDYLTGELDRALTVSVENHLQACESCRNEVTDLRRVWASLDQLTAVEPPPFFHENLMHRLDAERVQAEEAAARKRAFWDWGALLRPRSLAYAAALLLLAVLGVGVATKPNDKPILAHLNPLSWVQALVAPSAEVSPPLLSLTKRAEWVTGTDGTAQLVVRLKVKALPEGVQQVEYQLSAPDYAEPLRGALSPEKEAVVPIAVKTRLESSAVEGMLIWKDVAGQQREQTFRIPVSGPTAETPPAR